MTAAELARFTSDLATAKGEVERLTRLFRSLEMRHEEMMLDRASIVAERDELNAELASADVLGKEAQAERDQQFQRAEAAEAALVRAQKVVEAARNVRKCALGSHEQGVAYGRLCAALDIFDKAAPTSGGKGTT